MAEQINQVIDALCEKFGVAADYLFPLLIKQARIDGAISIMSALLCVIFVIAYGLMLKFLFKPRENKRNQCLMEMWDCDSLGLYTGSWVGILVLGIVAIVALIAIPLNISTAIKAFSNPEWYAIQEIFGLANRGG